MTPTDDFQTAFAERDYRARHLRDQSQSAQSVAEYCRSHNLSAATFYYWRRQAGECGKEPNQSRLRGGVSFTEIARMGEPQERWVAEVALPSGAVVRVSAAADARLLRMLVEALG